MFYMYMLYMSMYIMYIRYMVDLTSVHVLNFTRSCFVFGFSRISISGFKVTRHHFEQAVRRRVVRKMC